MAAVTNVAAKKDPKTVRFEKTSEEETAAKTQKLSPLIAKLNEAMQKITTQPKELPDPWQFQPDLKRSDALVARWLKIYNSDTLLQPKHRFSIPAADFLPETAFPKAPADLVDATPFSPRQYPKDDHPQVMSLHQDIVLLDAMTALFQRVWLQHVRLNEMLQLVDKALTEPDSDNDHSRVRTDREVLAQRAEYIFSGLHWWHNYILKDKTRLETACTNYFSGVKKSTSATERMRTFCNQLPKAPPEPAKPNDSKFSPLEVSAAVSKK